MTVYRHTQTGTLILASIGAAVLLTLIVLGRLGFHPVALGVLAFLLLLTVLFHSLTVEVTSAEIRIRFGPGPIRKSFPLIEIIEARAVRNSWWYGWGIRLTPHGWLFNVSGLDAVELRMTDERKYRIGTDEPRALLQVIAQASDGRVSTPELGSY
jgi:hypothetical protein